ncbi:hypothetical protein V6N11_080434 [Hibiscus sabdariffa]|uniref:Uncharacterized protein n=1 Tax=Hibiscus sabdariffa TaxID=183260 RepID=A0ABR2R7M7_9ROSI
MPSYDGRSFIYIGLKTLRGILRKICQSNRTPLCISCPCLPWQGSWQVHQLCPADAIVAALAGSECHQPGTTSVQLPIWLKSAAPFSALSGKTCPRRDDKGDASNRDNGSYPGRYLGGDSDLGRALGFLLNALLLLGDSGEYSGPIAIPFYIPPFGRGRKSRQVFFLCLNSRSFSPELLQYNFSTRFCCCIHLPRLINPGIKS